MILKHDEIIIDNCILLLNPYISLAHGACHGQFGHVQISLAMQIALVTNVGVASLQATTTTTWPSVAVGVGLSYIFSA